MTMSENCGARIFAVGDSSVVYICQRLAGNHLTHAAQFEVEVVERDRVIRSFMAMVTWTEPEDLKKLAGL